MAKKSHEELVGGQFGVRAEAYLTSAVHAAGADLDALAALAHGRAEARVLDLGCGGGHVAFKVAPSVREVVAYDLSPEMLGVVARAARERGHGNLATRQGVVESLPFPDASFDLVLSRFSAHHWRNAEAALREAARVLTPGGVLGIVDSISPGTPLLDTYYQAIEVLRDVSHVRNYSRAEWEGMLARAGFLAGETRQFRLRLDFQTWIERIGTPKVQADAIRALQAAMSNGVARYFETAPDGSFAFDIGFFQAAKPAG
ncbi:MAG: methyltransferase domain-containing protein [Rhodospirillaceae bacterium]|nr:methyltransferase domain-containing protein [Rhodospirillaceae bacterium]